MLVRYLGLALLAACAVDETAEFPDRAPLASFDGTWHLEQATDGGVTLRLVRADDGLCPLLAFDVEAVMDGVPGEIERGLFLEDPEELPYEDNDTCIAPTVHWKPFATGATSTFVVRDHTTTRTLTVDAPFTARTWSLAPFTSPLHGGDTLVLDLDVPAETVSVRVELIADEPLLGHTEQQGTRVLYTLPAVTAPTTATLVVSGAARIASTCDVPGGCKAVVKTRSELVVELAP